MNILYGFSNCSYHKYNDLFKDASVMVLQQAQKYHSLMMRGLVENGVHVQAISGLPINRGVTHSLVVRGGADEECGVKYHYFGTVNLPGVRQLTIVLKTFFYTLFKRKVDVAVCDILNISVLIGMLMACRLRRLPILGIVTDVPGKLADNGRSPAKRIDGWLMSRMDGYVFLTEWMNPVVNPRHKPYVVIEGQVDSSMKGKDNERSAKESPRVLMYAGSIKKIYGIKTLTDAFVAAGHPDWQLHIYGDGDFRHELIELTHRHPNVKYRGIKLNDEIVAAEMTASLLVNPRPTNQEYVKYSFPSKNMEYMVSGTPVLTTRLPGMPDEYLEHVYLLEDETPEGMAQTLKAVLSLTADELHDKGMHAKEFVLEYKNQKTQASKVYNLLKTLAG